MLSMNPWGAVCAQETLKLMLDDKFFETVGSTSADGPLFVGAKKGVPEDGCEPTKRIHRSLYTRVYLYVVVYMFSLSLSLSIVVYVCNV